MNKIDKCAIASLFGLCIAPSLDLIKPDIFIFLLFLDWFMGVLWCFVRV